MQALKRKATSQRGASITFALLLFLVCAILSGIVIVAATATAGRMSQRAQIDQRYYAVNSAAELLKDDLEGKRVTIEHKMKGGAVDSEPRVTKIVDLASPSSTITVTNCPVLAETSLLLVQKIVDPDSFTSPSALDDTLTLTASATVDKAALGCTIDEYVDADRKQLVLDISNTIPENATDPTYTLKMTLNASVAQTTSERETIDDDGKKQTISTVTTNIEWKLGSIRK